MPHNKGFKTDQETKISYSQEVNALKLHVLSCIIVQVFFKLIKTHRQLNNYFPECVCSVVRCIFISEIFIRQRAKWNINNGSVNIAYVDGAN